MLQNTGYNSAPGEDIMESIHMTSQSHDKWDLIARCLKARIHLRAKRFEEITFTRNQSRIMGKEKPLFETLILTCQSPMKGKGTLETLWNILWIGIRHARTTLEQVATGIANLFVFVEEPTRFCSQRVKKLVHTCGTLACERFANHSELKCICSFTLCMLLFDFFR
ncbi:hypothetical protein AVEN_31758-1 [Araneus ventricosus]|uniref:Uncharacterized protein n=1 Tax=Araneus ventricosus TaxID=182803 RepID=A0A4Y2L6F3_ARAVE|nr:hypothetical protein AVEN_31758-1 [Araneus ventricosus]